MKTLILCAFLLTACGEETADEPEPRQPVDIIYHAVASDCTCSVLYTNEFGGTSQSLFDAQRNRQSTWRVEVDMPAGSSGSVSAACHAIDRQCAITVSVYRGNNIIDESRNSGTKTIAEASFSLK